MSAVLKPCRFSGCGFVHHEPGDYCLLHPEGPAPAQAPALGGEARAAVDSGLPPPASPLSAPRAIFIDRAAGLDATTGIPREGGGE